MRRPRLRRGFADMPLVEFEFRDQPAYLNATDVLAFVSITILAVRFAAWALGLLRSRRPRSDPMEFEAILDPVR